MENKRFTTAEAMEVEGKLLAVASDETVDREGEILSIDGWDLKEFKKNPVLLWSHSMLDISIGRANKIGYKEINGKKKLVFEPEFHDETELSKTIHKLVDRGFLKTFSVGFLPSEAEGNKFVKQKLLEISVVNVPANANAEIIEMSYDIEKAYVKSLNSVKNIETENEEPEEEPVVEEETTENEDIKQLKQSIEEMRAEIKSLIESANSKPVEVYGQVDGRSEQGTPQLRKSRKLINSIKYAAEHLQEIIKE